MGCSKSKIPVEEPPPLQNLFIVGPVVGWVDGTTARILIETAEDAIVTMKAFAGRDTKDENAVAATVQKKVKARRPTALQLTGLKPGVYHTVEVVGECAAEENHEPVRDINNLVYASFTTLDPTRKQLRIGYVSCNNKTYFNGSRLWDRMKQRINDSTDGRPGLDLLVHMGDQAYCDGERHLIERGSPPQEEKHKVFDQSCWEQGMELLKAVPHEEWESLRESLVENFRGTYRRTWNHPPCKAVLASVPNIMTLDDHDIRDDYGTAEGDEDPKTLQGFLGTCGLQAYYEYQMQLLRDVDFSDIFAEKAYSIKTVGPHIGLILMEMRIEQSLARRGDDMSGPEWVDKKCLGPRQHADIEHALENEFKNVSQLFVVAPSPMLLLSAGLTTFAGKFLMKDCKGCWTVDKYIQERDNLLRRFATWADQDPKRSVVLTAGDIHVGGHSKAVVKEQGKEFTLHQLASSAVCNEFMHEEWLKVSIGQAVLRLDASLRQREVNGVSIYHSRYHFVNNASYIDVDLSPLFSANGNGHRGRFSQSSSGRPRARGTLLIGNGKKKHTVDLTMNVGPEKKKKGGKEKKGEKAESAGKGGEEDNGIEAVRPSAAVASGANGSMAQ